MPWHGSEDGEDSTTFQTNSTYCVIMRGQFGSLQHASGIVASFVDGSCTYGRIDLDCLVLNCFRYFGSLNGTECAGTPIVLDRIVEPRVLCPKR